MLGNNLTNQPAPAIGVRFEGIVYNYGKLNLAGKGFLEQLTNDTVNLYLLTTTGERKAASFCYKWAVPYTRIIQVESVLEIPEICIQHEFILYYDTDGKVIEQVGQRGKVRTKGEVWTLQEDSSPESLTSRDLMKSIGLELEAGY